MSDQITARLRTVWPLVVGHLAALVAAAILHLTGITVDSSLVLELLGLAGSWVAWEAGQWLTRRPNPTGQAIGRWLISAGRDTGQPTYPATTDPASR